MQCTTASIKVIKQEKVIQIRAVNLSLFIQKLFFVVVEESVEIIYLNMVSLYMSPMIVNL